MDKNSIINGVPEGWKELVRYGLKEFEENGGKLKNISYIKEKYGRLRFEYSGSGDILEDIETASGFICVKCGKAGRVRYDLPCYCDDHYSLEKNKKD